MSELQTAEVNINIHMILPIYDYLQLYSQMLKVRAHSDLSVPES